MLSSGDVFHLVSVIQGQVNQPLHKATDLREKVTVTSATTTVADVTGELFPFFLWLNVGNTIPLPASTDLSFRGCLFNPN